MEDQQGRVDVQEGAPRNESILCQQARFLQVYSTVNHMHTVTNIEVSREYSKFKMHCVSFLPN